MTSDQWVNFGAALSIAILFEGIVFDSYSRWERSRKRRGR